MPDMRGLAWYSVPGDIDPRTRIADNFSAWELYKSEIALRQRIDNHPPEAEFRRSVHLAREVLQPIRDAFGVPYTPTSVYRCQELERALKGKPLEWVSRSQHAKGEAADIEIPTIPNQTIALWIADRIEFDQLILELHDPDAGPDSGWVHVSLRPDGRNRRQVLSYIRVSRRRYRYVEGLVDSH